MKLNNEIEGVSKASCTLFVVEAGCLSVDDAWKVLFTTFEIGVPD